MHLFIICFSIMRNASCCSSYKSIFVVTSYVNISNSSSTLVIFSLYSLENEASFTKFKGYRFDFGLMFFLKFVSTANVVKIF